MELTASIPLSTIKKIELYQNLNRLPMATIKARTGADYIINGGIYSFQTFKPFGNVKIDGKIIYSPGYGEYGFAWNEGSDISYERLPSNKRSYLGCVGMVLGGVKQVMHFAASFGGKRQRSAIGLKDGNLVLYACNGIHSKTPEALQAYAIKKGWKCGLLLDGGGSTQCCFPNGTIKSPENNGKGRIVQNYILVYIKKESAGDSDEATTSTCPYQEPTVTLRRGSAGDGVRWLQWHLKRTVTADLKIDGEFGKNTENAVKQFQLECGLIQDGVAGGKTIYAIKNM